MASNFAAALETWRAINLQELQKKLDGQGIEIVDNQKEGLLGRKALADKTKGASCTFQIKLSLKSHHQISN